MWNAMEAELAESFELYKAGGVLTSLLLIVAFQLLYLGFNTDGSGRQVFDGMIPHIAGSSRLDLNRPGADPIGLGMFTATSFPFTDAALRDPVTGVVDGTLGNDRGRNHQPRIFYTNTGVEYWGGGRVASRGRRRHVR